MHSSKLLVSYLAKAAPNAIALLRNKYPNEVDLFSPSLELGPGSRVDPAAPSSADRAAKIALVSSTADRLKPDLDRIASSLRQRLKVTGMARLAGGIVAAASGFIGAIFVLAGSRHQWVKDVTPLATAGCALLGGLTTLLADSYEKSPTSKSGALESFQKLSDMKADVLTVAMKIERDAVFPLKDLEISDAMDLLGKVAVAVLRLGYA